jgi:DNA-binding NarL/FixJ family response regulator
MPDAAIAAPRLLSVRTAENQVDHILARLGVRSRAGAVAAAPDGRVTGGIPGAVFGHNRSRASD